MTDAWTQRFDQGADEDDRYHRSLELERFERAREQASLDGLRTIDEIHARGLTIDDIERTIADGVTIKGNRVNPALLRPTRPLWRRVIGWTLFIVVALVLAVAVAVTIIEAVAWVTSGP